MDTALEQRILELVQQAIKEVVDVKPKYKTTQYYLENVEGYRDKANLWSLQSYHRNRDKVLAKKNERYQTDEAFREKCQERARKSREKRKQEKLDKEAKLKEAS